jgi:catechol 2,3-dioxygenase-like lactoylglutathione lyase family enzyme
MALEGLHHITAITGDAPRNVDFYARALGLRLVKKTVNFDQPDVADAPLAAAAGDIPTEHALRGFAGVRAYASRPAASAKLLGALGFEGTGATWELAGDERRARWSYDPPPGRGGLTPSSNPRQAT